MAEWAGIAWSISRLELLSTEVEIEIDQVHRQIIQNQVLSREIFAILPYVVLVRRSPCWPTGASEVAFRSSSSNPA